MEDSGYRSVELSEVIKNAIETLNETQKKIFNLRFIENKTQSEVAKVLGVSQMTISRAEKEIRKKFEKEMGR